MKDRENKFKDFECRSEKKNGWNAKKFRLYM